MEYVQAAPAVSGVVAVIVLVSSALSRAVFHVAPAPMVAVPLVVYVTSASVHAETEPMAEYVAPVLVGAVPVCLR